MSIFRKAANITVRSAAFARWLLLGTAFFLAVGWNALAYSPRQETFYVLVAASAAMFVVAFVVLWNRILAVSLLGGSVGILLGTFFLVTLVTRD